MAEEFVPCTAMYLPTEMQVAAARAAVMQNPLNAPANSQAGQTDLILPAGEIAVLTKRYWGNKGVKLTVSFMEQTELALKKRILSHANAWGEYGNIQFILVDSDGQVRITRSGSGYWSFLGSDILLIARGEPTMCLQGFTMNHSEAEFRRVVRHEFGHTLGFPHEHMRSQIVNKLDHQKTIAYFQQTQGWSPAMTMQQVLTPLAAGSIMGTPDADENSIMTYSLPGLITKDGKPIIGGKDIEQQDAAFVSQIYPVPSVPAPPPPPISDAGIDMKMSMDFDTKTVSIFLPSGWKVTKENANTTMEDVAMGPYTMTSLANELEACLPKHDEAGVTAAAPGGILATLLALVAALRSGDWKAVAVAVRDVLNMVLGDAGSDGGIQFQQAVGAAGIPWATLKKILLAILSELL